MKICSGLEEGQVLQRLGARGAAVTLRGTCAEEGSVFATISHAGRPLRGWHRHRVGRVVSGKFQFRLSEIPAGGPYRLRLEAGGGRADIAAFFVGDVWILAGQSNMEGCGKIAGAARPHRQVRAFSMRREWRPASDPLHILAESPDPCHHGDGQCSREKGELLRREATVGTGVGIFFAREMLRRSGVPQGLICVAHGGTSMREWSPARKQPGGESLYSSMLASVQGTGQPVAGILWYQGESDANPTDAPQYTGRMRELVASLRRDLRQPGLPWIAVQIGRYFNANEDFARWNSIQEQQRLLPSTIKRLEMVAAIDLPLDDSLHVGGDGFPVLARRMARAADRLVLGNTQELPAPRLRSIRAITVPKLWDCAIEVRYDHVCGGLRANGPASGFTLITADGKPFPIIYRTTLHGDCVRLYADCRFIADKRLCYGAGFSPTCTITDARNFALPVFGPLDLNHGFSGCKRPITIGGQEETLRIFKKNVK